MSSWGNDALLICGAAAGLLTGCQLGGDGDDDLGPYQNAQISVSAPEGVADGLTGVEVTVTGDVGSRLVLELIGGGQFLNSDPGNASEKTLFLAGEGTATAEVVSTRPIEIAVFRPFSRSLKSVSMFFRSVSVSTVALYAGFGLYQYRSSKYFCSHSSGNVLPCIASTSAARIASSAPE